MHAPVAESVDALDLKSNREQSRCQFKSGLEHFLKDSRMWVFFYVQTFLPVQLRSKLLRIQAHTLQQSVSGAFCKVWPGAFLKRLTNVGLFLCPDIPSSSAT